MTKAIYVVRVPRFPEPPRDAPTWFRQWAEDVKRWADRFGQEVETHSDVTQVPAEGRFVVTNVTTDRTYNADSTSTEELADVLGTVIAALQDKGILE